MTTEAENTGFDYGTEPVEAGGANFKNPEVGPHPGRLRSLIHVGMFAGSYQGKPKPPAPTAIAIFELKGEDDMEEDGVTPLTISKDFAIKKGDKSFMTKLISVLDPKGKCKGFDDMIGAPGTLTITGSTELNDDKTPKYANFGGVASIPPEFHKMIQPLVEGLGVGHVRFKDITKEALLELHPIRHVALILMKSQDYPGSHVEKLVAEIRKDNPDFAKQKAKDGTTQKDGEAKHEGEDMPPEQQAPNPALDSNEEF